MAWECSCGNYNDDKAEKCLRCGAAKPAANFAFDLDAQLKSTAGNLFDLFGRSSGNGGGNGEADYTAPVGQNSYAEEGEPLTEEQQRAEEIFREAMDIVDDDPVKAFEMLTEAAATGHARAEDELGESYFYGRGVDTDYEKAAYWYERAARKGVVTAQYNFGYCLRYGEGVEKNPALAAEWLKKAVENGSISARLELGDLYYFGEGVARDYKKAVEHYR